MGNRKFAPTFKLQIAREVEAGEKRISQICREHSAFARQLEVGCVCAGKMEEDGASARRRDQALKTKAGCRQRWLSRKWRASAKGNPTLKADGCRVTIFPDRYREGHYRWLVASANDDDRKEGAAAGLPTEEAARLDAFETWWKMAHGDNEE